MNLFMNPNYSLDSVDYMLGLERYQDWKRLSLAAARQTDSNLSDENLDGVLDFVFKHAPFLREHLSVHQIQNALESCTNEILNEVRLDIDALREIIVLFSGLVEVFTSHFSDHFRLPSFDNALPQLFSMVKLFAWLDISLRVRGYGNLIDRLREDIPGKIKESFTPEMRDELNTVGPEIAATIENEMLKLIESFQTLALRR
jgi:hypothetical protein